jgi:hypothetical protein
MELKEKGFEFYSCKDCRCFFREQDSDEGICVLNPPQTVVLRDTVTLRDEIYSVYPNVDKEKSKCARMMLKDGLKK